MKEKTEHERRVCAIELYQQGKGFEGILRQVGRCRSWLAKWLGRFREGGKAGLKDQSRVPHRIWRKTPVAKGKVSWTRKVDGRGRIEVNGKAYFIRRRLSGQYVVATLFTHRQRLVIK